MVDAYEIGIQLALQDDVSAGLEVIGRELAEVDRAIATTNAGLAELVRAAGQAQGAVAKVSGAQPMRTAGSEPPAADRESVAAERTAVSSPEAPPPTIAPVTVEPRVESDHRPDRRGDDGVAPVAPAQVVEPKRAGEARAEVGAVPIQPAAAPLTEPAITPDQRASAPIAPVEMAGEIERDAAGPAPVAAGVAPQAAGRFAVAPEALAADRRAITVTSRVQTRRTATDAGNGAGFRAAPLEADMPDDVTRVAAPPARAAAAAPIAVPAAAVPRVTMPSERSAAPAAAEGSSERQMGGTVMLDGRLVGYWLAEHLAREAARPPGGTSFFDPRQSPAWTASGAM